MYVWSTKLASFTLLKTWENEQPKRKVGIKTASFKIHLDLSKNIPLTYIFRGEHYKKIFIGIYTIWHVEGIYVVLNLFSWIVWEVTGNLRHFTVPPCPEIFEAKTYTQK